MNMNNWRESVIYGPKKPFPLLSYPSVQDLHITVKEMCCSSSYQAIGMRLIADRYDMLASTAYMDLSVEAEAFGAFTVYGADEIPTITGRLIKDMEDAEKLEVPEIGAGRTGTCIRTISKAIRLINDKPIFAGCTGPFSLAGRLLNVNDIMMDCYEDPELVHLVLKKASAFILKYVKALKKAGADGVIMAEPLAGILSPALAREFSTEYVRQIVDEVQDEKFMVMYHNCGNNVNYMVSELIDTGSMAFHFGEHANMKDLLEKLPSDRLVLGNISSANAFKNNTVENMNLVVRRLLADCGGYKNFIPSSSCDVPPATYWENIDEFFHTIEAQYYMDTLWNKLN